MSWAKARKVLLVHGNVTLAHMHARLYCSPHPLVWRHQDSQSPPSLSRSCSQKEATSKSVLGDMLAKGCAEQEFHKDLTKAFSTRTIPLGKGWSQGYIIFFRRQPLENGRKFMTNCHDVKQQQEKERSAPVKSVVRPKNVRQGSQVDAYKYWRGRISAFKRFMIDMLEVLSDPRDCSVTTCVFDRCSSFIRAYQA